MIRIFKVTLLITCLLAQFGEEPLVALLRDQRHNIDFMEYTPRQRQDIAKAIVNVLKVCNSNKIWVNEAAKQKFHDIDRDPLATAQDIAKIAASLSDDEFHSRLSALFMSLKDGHTLYKLPGPHSCYSAAQAISFSVIGGEKKQRIIVSEFIKRQKVLDLSPNVSKISVGDELVSVENLSIENYFEKYKNVVGGANDGASQRALLLFMSVRDGKQNRMPDVDQVQYELRSYKTGEMYNVTLPWVTLAIDSCYNEWTRASRSLESFPAARTSEPKFSKTTILQSHSDKLLLFQDNFIGDLAPKGLKITDTLDPTLKFGIWRPETDNVGVIILKSFYPSSKDAISLTAQIRDLLMKQLRNTNSLIIDVRDNPGGLINLADYIPQLFGTNIEPVKGTFRVSRINDVLIKNTFSKHDKWFQSYFGRRWFSKYSSPLEFSSKRYVNYVGQAYIKPVGVLLNARCFSSCDIFAANMKDNGIATLFGEDSTTGGGGANVVSYNEFLNIKGGDLFPALPYSTRQGAQDITVSWRQVSRVKQAQGKLIEDFGVEVDQLVLPVIEDFLNSDSNSQYQLIAQNLAQISMERGLDKVYFHAIPAYDLDATVDSKVTIEITSQGINRVLVLQADTGQVISTVEITNLIDKRTKEIIEFRDESRPGYRKIILNAYDTSNRMVYSTARQVRYLPRDKLIILPEQTKELEFVANYTAEYTVDMRPYEDQKLSKWIRTSSSLTLEGYAEYTNTLVSWFVNVDTMTSLKLSVDITYDTETDSDYLYVSYRSAFGTQQLLNSYTTTGSQFKDGISGQGRISKEFTLTDLDQDTEITVQFKADGNTAKKGVVVHKMTLSGLPPTNSSSEWI